MSEARPRSKLRYIVPNAITSLGLGFAAIAIERAIDGRPIEAAWWGLLVTLTDKADGFFAKLLNAGSEFGVQLDSLVDLIAFGVVPATVCYAFFRAHSELGWGAGGAYGLRASCILYMLAAALRLARFNVTAAEGPSRVFRGIPSTMTAGTLLAFFLFCVKYADPALRGGEPIDDWRLLGGVHTDGILRLVPYTLLLGGVGMLSPLRVPKLGRTVHLLTDALLIVSISLGYGLGIARRMPEYLVAGALFYLGLSVLHHIRSIGSSGDRAPRASTG